MCVRKAPTYLVVTVIAVPIASVIGVAAYRIAGDSGSECGAFASSVNSAVDSSDAPVGDITLLDNRLRPCRTLTDDGQSIDPAISPDGRRVAFISGRGYAFDEDFGLNEFQSAYVMSIDGSGQRRLSSAIATPPIVWSPDGRRIAYVANRTRTEVSIVDVDTGGTFVLHVVPQCTVVRWIDNRHVAFRCSRDAGNFIESVGVRSSVRRAITTLPTGASLWAPPYVVVLPDVGRASELLVRDLHTGLTHVISGSGVTGTASYSSVLLTTSDGHVIWQRHQYLGTYDVYVSDLHGGPAQLLWSQHGRVFPTPSATTPHVNPERAVAPHVAGVAVQAASRNGGYLSVTSKKAYAATRCPQRRTPSTKSKMPLG